MSERLVATIDQPCILCEDTLEVWHVYKDEERKGQGRIEKVAVDHECSFLMELVEERQRTRRSEDDF